MLGWALGFFVAAVIAAIFGFGIVASTFAGLAILLFWLFVGLTVVSLLLSLVSGRGAGAHGASSGSVAGIAAIAVAAAFAVLAYSWVQNDWSAERAGRALDQQAAELSVEAGQALEAAGERAETLIQNTSTQIRQDAAEGLDEAEQSVDPDQSQ